MSNNSTENTKQNNTNRKHRIIEIVLIIVIILLLFGAILPITLTMAGNKGVAKDAELINNLNTALRIDREEYHNEHRTMTDALDAAERNGYNVSQINANKTNNEILWDSKNDVFVYYNDQDADIEYISNSVEAKDRLSVKKANEVFYLWKICEKAPSLNYSMYWIGNQEDIPDILTSGFDAGKKEVTKNLFYKNYGINQEVTIRTNSFAADLTIDGPLDVVHHYGKSKTIHIKSVATHSYYEYGETTLTNIDKGRIVITKESSIGGIHFNAQDSDGDGENDTFDEIIVDISNLEENIPTFYRDPVNIDENGTLVCVVEEAESESFIWLQMEGIYEQISVSTTESGNREWVSTSESSNDTKQISNDIANSVDYESVNINEETREIIVEEGQTIDDVITEEGKSSAETEQIIEVQTNIKAYVEEDITTPNDLVGLYFNTQFSDSAFVDKAYRFNAYSSEDDYIVDAFINAKIGGKNIFSNNINDYANEEKIQLALSVVESELGSEAKNRAADLISKKKPYFNWLADFEVSFSQTIKVGSVALMGHYASFADEFVDGQWVGFGISDYRNGESINLVANKPIRLLDTAFDVTGNPDFHMNYAAICGYVRQFSCGFANLSDANVGVNITVNLNLYEIDEFGNETGNKLECGRYIAKLPNVSAGNKVIIK